MLRIAKETYNQYCERSIRPKLQKSTLRIANETYNQYFKISIRPNCKKVQLKLPKKLIINIVK